MKYLREYNDHKINYVEVAQDIFSELELNYPILIHVKPSARPGLNGEACLNVYLMFNNLQKNISREIISCIKRCKSFNLEFDVASCIIPYQQQYKSRVIDCQTIEDLTTTLSSPVIDLDLYFREISKDLILE